MKRAIVALILLFVLAGCQQQVDETEQTQTGSDLQTFVLVHEQEQTVENQLLLVRDEADFELFVRGESDTTIEFLNDNEDSQRLVIFGTNIDLYLAPNERVEVLVSAEKQTIEYVFGDSYKQIIVY